MADRQFGTAQTEQLGASLWLLKLVGEHDLASRAEVEDAFARIEATGTTVVIDLLETTFIDSTLIGRIAAAHERGENLLLIVPKSGVVRRVLDLVGLRIPTFETRAEALRAVPDQDQPH
jgi:anti-anti-sigma regulatory factor